MSFYHGSLVSSNRGSPILNGGENLKVVVESLEKSPSCVDTSWETLIDFFNRNSLVVLIFCAITFSYIYPALGAVYLHPNITASWVAVLVIFCEYLKCRAVTSFHVFVHARKLTMFMFALRPILQLFLGLE